MPVKVYISSTFADLIEYRRSVYEALRKMRIDAIAMEDYVAQDTRPLEKCLEDVASSDIYVGIFGWRYGYIPTDNNKDNNPNNLSITELEYSEAKEKGIPCLVFLLDESVPWPLKFSDGTPQSGTTGDNINRLREELKKNHSISFFKNKDELASNVLAAVTQIIRKRDQLSHQFSSSSSPSQNALLSNYQKILDVPFEFEDEKRVFVGRKDYIDKIIREKLDPIGSVVSIIGPGGSGKTQLAYKAIHQYIEEKFLML